MLRFTTFFVAALLAQTTVAYACSHEVSKNASPARDEESPVFVAKTLSAHSYVDPTLGVVMTEYNVATVECLSGACEPTATVVMLGGEVGDLVTRVAGDSEKSPSKGALIVVKSSRRAGGETISRRVAARQFTADIRERLMASTYGVEIASGFDR
ncbi:MAG: hypothetical protein IT381_20020 [Deltaproteobacteria bacterium]|nr:hypothetical protein [Deltaproteobacteria bacterium]